MYVPGSLFVNFRKMHGILNLMLPKYVKICFDDTKMPVSKLNISYDISFFIFHLVLCYLVAFH